MQRLNTSWRYGEVYLTRLDSSVGMGCSDLVESLLGREERCRIARVPCNPETGSNRGKARQSGRGGAPLEKETLVRKAASSLGNLFFCWLCTTPVPMAYRAREFQPDSNADVLLV